jgi:hypothetical protein
MADIRAPPTPLAMIIGTAIIAGVSGYMIGIASSLGLIPNPFVAKEPRTRGISNYDDEEESEEEDIDESILDHAPNWANGVEADKRDGLRATAAGRAEFKKEEVVKTGWEDSNEECKLVLVVRTDLGMTKGLSLFYTSFFTDDLGRQNRSTVRPCDFSLLQELPTQCTEIPDFEEMGKTGSSKNRVTSQE